MRRAVQASLDLQWFRCAVVAGVRRQEAARGAPDAAAAARRRRPTRAAPAGAARAGARADDRPAGAGARRCDRVGVARRPEPELAAEAGVLRARQQRARARTRRQMLDENAGCPEALRHLDRDDRRTLRRTRHSRVQSGFGRTARASRRAPISCRSASPPIGCGRSATARNSRSIRATTRRRFRRTAARISSSPRSERYETEIIRRSDRVAAVLAVAAGIAAPAARRRTRNTSR